MAPIRRYLRITKYSVLECRIYLDNPALAHSWLLNPRDPVLPRVIDSIRPLVLPKLREEKERAKKKSTKKRGIKDVIVEDDFEVSLFITETSTRHSLLYKHKHFRDKTQTKLVSNSNKLTGASRDAPIDVEDQDLHIDLGGLDAEDGNDVPVLRREESDEDAVVALEDIPAIEEVAAPAATARQSKRRRQRGSTGAAVAVIPDSSDEEADDTDDDLFVDNADPATDGDEDAEEPPSKRRRDDHADKDDKKKLAMDISYEGFAIYGRVLCLVVKRRETAARGSSGLLMASGTGSKAQSQVTAALGGQAVMENWITSTQMVPAEAESAETGG